MKYIDFFFSFILDIIILHLFIILLYYLPKICHILTTKLHNKFDSETLKALDIILFESSFGSSET